MANPVMVSTRNTTLDPESPYIVSRKRSIPGGGIRSCVSLDAESERACRERDQYCYDHRRIEGGSPETSTSRHEESGEVGDNDEPHEDMRVYPETGHEAVDDPAAPAVAATAQEQVGDQNGHEQGEAVGARLLLPGHNEGVRREQQPGRDPRKTAAEKRSADRNEQRAR